MTASGSVFLALCARALRLDLPVLLARPGHRRDVRDGRDGRLVVFTSRAARERRDPPLLDEHMADLGNAELDRAAGVALAELDEMNAVDPGMWS